MSDSVMLRLMDWSPAQLAAWRSSPRQPAPRYWLDRVRHLFPPEMVDGAIARFETSDPVPVGESLSVSFDQLSPDEQRMWRALSTNESLSPQERSEGMRASSIAERAWLSRLCDQALGHVVVPVQGRLFTDAELDESIPERLKLPAHQRRS